MALKSTTSIKNTITSKIAILPLGAYEYHGPHLPYDTDTIIAKGFISFIKRHLLDSSSIVFLPVEETGYSIEHQWKKETRSLSYHAAIERWIEIGKNCSEQGIKKLLLFNAHGGNSPLLTIVATELRIRYNMLCVITSWRKFGLPKGLIYQGEQDLDIHAGFIETSLLLALTPEKVLFQNAEDFPNQQKFFCKNYAYLRAYGSHAFGWAMQDLNAKGACGNAKAASKEAGEQMLNHVAKKTLLLLKDMDNFDLEYFNKKS